MSWIMNPRAMRDAWEIPLRALEARAGIPAEFGLAQFAHEALNPDNRISELAAGHHNWAGLKFARWMEAHGALPVTMWTIEHLNGTGERLTDAFASFPDTGRFLQAWADLLTSYYAGALRYRADPLLYGYHVWRTGWATDPAYMVGLAGRMTWLWEDGRHA